MYGKRARAMQITRGFAGIGLYHPKAQVNVGSALRAVKCYQADFLAVTGRRYEKSSSDVSNQWKHTPMFQVDDLKSVIPYECVPVAVDFIEGAIPLNLYVHPERAFYIFGPGDGTLDDKVLSWCRDVIYIPTNGCMNLAATVNVVLYDRLTKNPNVSKRQKPPRENRNQRSRFGSRSVAFNPPPECRFFNNIDIGDCDTKTRVRYLSQR